ncbi:MAG: hypothetical protein ACOC57_07550, partial [Acidobacteriota bacterium]
EINKDIKLFPLRNKKFSFCTFLFYYYVLLSAFGQAGNIYAPVPENLLYFFLLLFYNEPNLKKLIALE